MNIEENVEAFTNEIYHHRRTPVFTHGSSERQYFLSFPKFIIDYIIANPKSPKQWKKLIQTCKYWFDKNPIVVITCLYYNDVALKSTGWRTCSSDFCNYRDDQLLNVFDTPVKFWITDNLSLVNQQAARKLIPRLYKCDAKKFQLFDESLSLDELLFITSKAVDFHLVRYKEKNEEKILFEKIVEKLPATVETIEYFFNADNVTPDTFQKLSEMEHVKRLKRMILFASPSLDLDGLFKFMTKNKQIYIELDFEFPVRSAKVENFIEKLKNEDYGIHQRPRITYNRSF